MGSWGVSWAIGWILLSLGILGAVAAVSLAFAGVMRGDEPEAQTFTGAATAIAIAGVALIVAGASLRWCGSCCGDDCCDWEQEQHPNATLRTSAP